MWWPYNLGSVIFSGPLVASRHNNIRQRRGKILPKNIPRSDLDFKIVLSVTEKNICQNNIIHLVQGQLRTQDPKKESGWKGGQRKTMALGDCHSSGWPITCLGRWKRETGAGATYCGWTEVVATRSRTHSQHRWPADASLPITCWPSLRAAEQWSLLEGSVLNCENLAV